MMPASRIERLPGPRPHKKRSVPVVVVVVRRPGTETGSAIVYPEGTDVKFEHAAEVARLLRDQLA